MHTSLVSCELHYGMGWGKKPYFMGSVRDGNIWGFDCFCSVMTCFSCILFCIVVHSKCISSQGAEVHICMLIHVL